MSTLDTTLEKIKRLIDEHFRWGSDSHPLKSKLRKSNERERYVIAWLRQETAWFRATATTLIARIVPILNELTTTLPDREKTRFFYRIDSSNIVKGPESILEKMAREWTKQQPKFSFHNFHELKDIGRFRIVVNFLSDMEKIREALEAPFKASESRSLSPAQQNLQNEYHFESNQFDDAINIRPADRNKGERCLKGVFYPKNHLDYKIEVQIVTTLQEAWDKKDHFLVYERRRSGYKVEEKHEREIYAMSELLYIADLTFDRLKDEINKQPKAKTNRRRKAAKLTATRRRRDGHKM